MLSDHSSVIFFRVCIVMCLSVFLFYPRLLTHRDIFSTQSPYNALRDGLWWEVYDMATKYGSLDRRTGLGWCI